MNDPEYPDALPAQSRLHWYVIERVLGQGGFGITYLARDTNLEQRVAIKEYLPVEFATRMPDATIRSRTEGLRDRYRWGLERFIQEARTLARFDHPSIVRVHSVFEFNNTAYMVMRFEEGINLAALLDRRGTLPEDELLRIILPILDGLEGVHKTGFIHRDIKPDNIHIGDDGRPVLLDFGSARQSLGNAHTLTILVAPGYAPFEQYYSDSGNQGPWTDIYGLGATCYRAIAGRSPLDAVSRSKGILGSTQDVLVPATVIGAGRYSGRLLAAIDHALEFAEKDRPQSVTEWREELVGEAFDPDARADRRSVAASAWQPLACAADAIRCVVAPLARTAEPAPPQRPFAAPIPGADPLAGSPAPRRKAIAMAVSVAIVAAAVAAYVVYMERGDEARSRILALEKAIQEKDLADATRRRAEQQKQDDEARQRREQEQQVQAAQEKSRVEAAAKRDVRRAWRDARATPENVRVPEKKRPEETPRPHLNRPGACQSRSLRRRWRPLRPSWLPKRRRRHPAAPSAAGRAAPPGGRALPSGGSNPSTGRRCPLHRTGEGGHCTNVDGATCRCRSRDGGEALFRGARDSSDRSPTPATRARRPGWVTPTWKAVGFRATMPRPVAGTKRRRCRARPARRSSSRRCTRKATACCATTTSPTSGSGPRRASGSVRPRSSRSRSRALLQPTERAQADKLIESSAARMAKSP